MKTPVVMGSSGTMNMTRTNAYRPAPSSAVEARSAGVLRQWPLMTSAPMRIRAMRPMTTPHSFSVAHSEKRAHWAPVSNTGPRSSANEKASARNAPYHSIMRVGVKIHRAGCALTLTTFMGAIRNAGPQIRCAPGFPASEPGTSTRARPTRT